jgi:hypothetical protein
VLRQLDARSAAGNGSSAFNPYAGIDLISDALPFGRLWTAQVTDAIDYMTFYSRLHGAVIRVYDDPGNVMLQKIWKLRPAVSV